MRFIKLLNEALNEALNFLEQDVGSPKRGCLARKNLVPSERSMQKVCAICGKKSQMGGYLVKLRGKYNPTKKKRRYPNLQWTRLVNGKRILACAKCIKSFVKV